MAVTLLALLTLSQAAVPPEPQWSEFVIRAVATTRQRRPELVPLAERTVSLSPEELDSTLRQARRAWGAGRVAETLGVLRRGIGRAGPEDLPIFLDLTLALAKTGGWAELRDLLGANLRNPSSQLEPFLYAVATAETGVATPELDSLCRAWLRSIWDVPFEELGRIYPRNEEGLRRLVWATYASYSIRFDYGLFFSAEDRESEDGEAQVPIDSGHPQWATSEFHRRYPDDPIAAWLASYGGVFHHDTMVEIHTVATRKRRLATLDRLFTPVLRRLRKGDVLEVRMRQAMKDVESWHLIDSPSKKP